MDIGGSAPRQRDAAFLPFTPMLRPRHQSGLAQCGPAPHVCETMQTVLIVIHLIIVIALVIVVLLQRSEGGMGLGGGGGGVSGFMTGRGQANALTRTTAILAGIFFLTSITLSVLASQNRAPRSILDGAATTAPAVPGGPSAPAPGSNVLDQLRQLQDQSGAQPPRPSTPVQ